MSATDVQRIEVFTRWDGFSSPSHVAKLVIAREGGRLLREQVPEGQSDELPPECASALVAALSRPPVPQLEPALFDIPESVIRSHYGSLWTNDSPAHLVRITFSGTRIVTVRTAAQHAFMLPLKINDRATGAEVETFDPRVSQAMAALMPAGYLEKERLAGHLGMLEWDIQEHARRGEQPSDLLEITRPAGDVSDPPSSIEESQQRFRDEIGHILRGEESPAEKAAAERAGKLSERLLKRISPDDTRDLLARGANPGIADDVGQTALMHAASPPLNRERFRLLVEAGADVDARRNDGWTGLHLAAAGGMADAAEEWLRAGADVHARTPEGATPLMLAATWLDIVRLLLAAGADVNAADQDGHTALTWAIVKQSWRHDECQLDSMRAMIDAGVDVNQRDREGVTPLGHARRELARIQLEEEVNRAFHPDADSSRSCAWADRWMAEAAVNLVLSAGGRE
jgi:hypothetical protein